MWFDRFLKNEPNGIDMGKPVELAHDPWNGSVTSYAGVPATTRTTVALRGSGRILPAGKLVRSFALRGGAHETFGDAIVIARVTRRGGFDHLVAELATPTTIVSAGGVPLAPGTTTVHIRLMNESVPVRRGQRLTLRLGASTAAVDPSDPLYLNDVASGSATVSRLSISLSFLKAPVSRRLTAFAATPGVSSTQILIGGTGPLSGTETAYAPVLHGAQAYFAYVNAHGGVYGRKIVYKIVDDGYDPTKTVEATRELVEQDHVLAIFNSVGTEQNLAIRDYLNQQKVPQLFVGTGADSIAQQHAQDPWTMGFLPSFSGEGSVYGRDIAKHHPSARIAVLYEDSEYGQDLLAGVKRGLGKHASQIVSTQTYEPSDVTVSSQVAKLKSSGADTFLILALPKQAISAFVSAHQLGWQPRCYVTSVSIDPAVMAIVKFNGSGSLLNGAVSTAFLHDPADPADRKSKGVRLYQSIMRQYGKGLDPTQIAHIYGMAAAYTMVDALKHAGRNPTRDSLLRAATHLNEVNPFLQPGIPVRTSPSDYRPIGATYVVRYIHGVWTPQGKPIATG
jgi:branched-chain amino acid transport system substrate-binding protein